MYVKILKLKGCSMTQRARWADFPESCWSIRCDRSKTAPEGFNTIRGGKAKMHAPSKCARFTRFSLHAGIEPAGSHEQASIVP